MYNLTDNQLKGLEHNAEHNNKTVEEYVQWRLEQDADRGYKDYVATKISSLATKLTAEPTIIESVEIVIDAKIQEAVAFHAAVEEELKKTEEELVEGLIKEE